MGALTHNGEVLQSLPANASQINFDKTGTNLNSTQTENAIKEVNTKVNTNTDDITQLKSGLTNLQTVTITASEGVTISEASIKRVGKVIIGFATIELASDVATYGVIATLSVNVASKTMFPTDSGKFFYIAENDNKVRVWRQTSAAAYMVQFVAFAND